MVMQLNFLVCRAGDPGAGTKATTNEEWQVDINERSIVETVEVVCMSSICGNLFTTIVNLVQR